MGQELYVLQCFSCETFQSHIVKKANKWECKVCGAKQSIKKVYGRGSGKDCRLHTQKLNSMRVEKEDTKLIQKVNEQDCTTTSGQSDYNIQPPLNSNDVKVNFTKANKWASYLDDDISDINKENPPTQGRTARSYDIDVESNTVLKRKRKHILHESYTVNEQMDGVKFSDLNEDNLSDLCSPDSVPSKVKKNDNRNFTERHNDYGGFNVNNTVKKNEKVISPSFGGKKEVSKQTMGNETNSKWAKYLVDESEEEEESSHDQYESVSPMSMNSPASFSTNENILNSAILSDYNLNNPERERQFAYKTGDCMLKYSNHCSSSENDQSSDVVAKGPNSSLNASVLFKEHKKNLDEVQISTDLLSVKAPRLTSLPIFEQNCDLNNSDFQLDF